MRPYGIRNLRTFTPRKPVRTSTFATKYLIRTSEFFTSLRNGDGAPIENVGQPDVKRSPRPPFTDLGRLFTDLHSIRFKAICCGGRGVALFGRLLFPETLHPLE